MFVSGIRVNTLGGSNIKAIKYDINGNQKDKIQNSDQGTIIIRATRTQSSQIDVLQLVTQRGWPYRQQTIKPPKGFIIYPNDFWTVKKCQRHNPQTDTHRDSCNNVTSHPGLLRSLRKHQKLKEGSMSHRKWRQETRRGFRSWKFLGKYPIRASPKEVMDTALMFRHNLRRRPITILSKVQETLNEIFTNKHWFGHDNKNSLQSIFILKDIHIPLTWTFENMPQDDQGEQSYLFNVLHTRDFDFKVRGCHV